jgi:hypothetical protein
MKLSVVYISKSDIHAVFGTRRQCAIDIDKNEGTASDFA